ncbi:hypothetical protein PYCC9005_001338 [Savitreella phatthalungensis]
MSKDSKDWFYVCTAHLKQGFATPAVDEAAVAAAEKERQKQAEIARVKAEYEAKQKAKRDKAKDDDGKDKDEKKSSGAGIGGWINYLKGSTESSSQDDKAKPTTASTSSVTSSNVAPESKEWILHRTVYNHRCELKQQAAREKAKAEQWKQLQFPSAPTGSLSK